MTETNGHVDLGGYALGLLSADDRVHFEAHLESCEVCRTELEELAGAARMLRSAVPAVATPPGLERKVFRAVDRAAAPSPPVPQSPRRRRRRPVLALSFGAAALSAAAALLVLAMRPGPTGALELQAVLAGTSGARAEIEVRKTGIGRVIELRTDDLEILPRGAYYELWFVGPGDAPAAPNRISAGTFHPDENGRSHVTFAAAVDPALYPVLSVTAEPGDGDPRPTGPEVLRSSR